MNSDSSKNLDQWLEIIALCGILVVAAFLRFYNLSHQGFLVSDEGAYVIGARRLVEHAYWMGYSFFRPGFLMLVIWASSLVGSSPLAAAGVSAVLGLITVGVVYCITRELFEKQAALVSTALFATSTYHVFYSRVGLSNVAAVFFFTLGLYCWVRFSAERRRGVMFPFAAGLLFGYAFTCHYSLALFLGLLGVVELWWAIQARAYRGSLLLLVGAFLPYAALYAQDSAGKELPELRLASAPTNSAAFRWQLAYENYGLQSAGNIASPSWQPVAGTRSQTGAYWQLTSPLGAGQEFFRISKP